MGVITGLVKFPVTTERGIYKVTVDSEYITNGLYQWVVEVYRELEADELPKKKWYERKAEPFELLYTRRSGWGNYKKYAEDLKGLAKDTVKSYEEEVAEEIRYNTAVEKSLSEFENWDGRI